MFIRLTAFQSHQTRYRNKIHHFTRQKLENSGLLQVEENSNNNGKNGNSIVEQLMLNNVSSSSSEPQESGTDSGGQDADDGTFPFNVIHEAIVRPIFYLVRNYKDCNNRNTGIYYSKMAWWKRNRPVITLWIIDRSGTGISNWRSYDL